MVFYTLVLTIAILSAVNGQTFTKGQCNSQLETVHDFNDTRTLGEWFLMKRSYDAIEDETKCHRIMFKEIKDGSFIVEESFEEKSQARLAKALSDRAVAENLEKKDERSSVRYKVHAKAEDLKNGKFYISPGLVSDTQEIWFLGIDYDKFLVMYSCVNNHDGKVEFLWIMTRTSQPDNAIISKAEEVLKYKNIALPLISVEHECKK